MTELAAQDSHQKPTVGFILTLAALGGIQVVFGLAAGWGNWLWALAPALILFGLVSVMWPRASLFLFVPLIFLRITVPGLVGVYPADLFSFLVLAVAALRVLKGDGPGLRPNSLLLPMSVVLAVFAISILHAYAPGKGLVHWLRHVQMFGLIAAIPVLCAKRDIPRLERLVLATSLVLLVPTLIEFFRIAGRERVFGITYVAFPFFLAMGIFYSISEFLMAPTGGKRWTFLTIAGILAVGVIASQTREAMLQITIGLVVMGMLVWKWGRRFDRRDLQKRVAWLAIIAIVATLVFVLGQVGPLAPSAHRLDEAIQGTSTSINIRLFLWRTGIRAFLESPILGIGFGQITVWDQFLPYWRFDPLSGASRGLGVHNDVISYAAESGIVGLAVVFWLLATVIRIGHSKWKNITRVEDLNRLLVLWIPCISIVARFFFGTHTFYSLGGMMNCLYFGLLVAHCRESDTGTGGQLSG